MKFLFFVHDRKKATKPATNNVAMAGPVSRKNICSFYTPAFRAGASGQHGMSCVTTRKCRARGERIAGMISLGYFRDEPRSQHHPLPLMRWFYPDRGNFIAVAGAIRLGISRSVRPALI